MQSRQNRQSRNNRQPQLVYSAFDTAIYYLTFRDRSRKELEDKLKEKGYDASEIETAIQKLTDYGYINDERYVCTYIKSQMKGKGKRRIIMELNGKGVDSELTQSVFSDVAYDETEAISDLLQRRYSNLDFEDDAQVRRMYAFFARRGFRYEDIRSVVSEYRKNNEKY